jgi:hypothetical protein
MNTLSSMNSIVAKRYAPFVAPPVIFPTLNSTPLTTNSTNLQGSAMFENYVLTVSNASGSMRRSTNYGATFNTVTNANTNFTNAAWRYVAIYQNQAIAVSTTNVFTSNDYGATWTIRTTATTTNNSGCTIYNGLMIVADQANSRLYFSSDNGATWRFQSFAFPRGCAVTQNGTTYVVVVCGMDSGSGVNPLLFRICSNFNPAVTTNSFVNCTFSGTVPLLVDLDGQYGVAVCLAGATSRIKYSTNYGQNWTNVSPSINTQLASVSLSGGYAIVTGYVTTYYTSNNNGQTWTTRTTTDTFATTGANYGSRAVVFTRSSVTTANALCYYGTLT